MSWSDDMRCLYCDGKLPLYRKITHGQFCSTAHRKAYWQEQERLAVERLHQTHNSLRAYRPAVPAEAILGPAEATVAELASEQLSGFITTLLVPQGGDGPRMIVTDPVFYELEQSLDAPVWTLPELRPRELPVAGAVDLRWVPQPQRLFLSSPAELSQREVSIPVCRPVGLFSPSLVRLPVAEATQIPLSVEAVSSEITVRSTSPEPAAVRVPAPFIHLQLNAAPEPLPLEPAEEVYPQADQLFALPKFAASKIASGPISFPRVFAAHPQALLPHEGSRSIAAARLQPDMGKGRRYPIEYRSLPARSADPVPADLSVLPPEIALPYRKVEAVLQTAERGIESFVPEMSLALLPLAFGKLAPSKPAPPRTMVVSTIPQPLRPKAILPKSRLEPVNPRPVFEIPDMPAAVLTQAAVENQPLQDQPERKHLWTHAAGFLKHAPRDLKILLFTIPALLVLAFHPPLPKVHFSAPVAASSGHVSQNVRTAVAGQWANVKQAVFERAAVALDEDFRTGLDDWTSRSDATAEWSFDATGFVRPGPLALYRPSMNLRDYQMQFLGLIDKKALSWVVRAVDFDNYYVVKMVVLKPGPLTTLGITRYAVIDGKAENRSDTIVPIDARPDMLYRVTMDVHDDTFALSIQGQMTDSWSEPRLSKGGIGFFNARGEESRIRWVQVTHQYDMLGRLCAYLAPYDIPTTNGSW
jgi:hypothetical protein